MVTFISSGRDYKIFNLTLNSTFQNVNITIPASSFLIQVKNDSKIRWRKNATDTTEFTFKIGMNYSIDGSMGAKSGDTVTIGQVRLDADSGSDTLEVWAWQAG